MIFYKKLYISPGIRNPRRIKRDLVRGRGHFCIYVLVLAPGSEGRQQLEIMHCMNLQQQYYRERPPFIVGIAEGIDGAYALVEQITLEAYYATGEWSAAAYLASKTGIS